MNSVVGIVRRRLSTITRTNGFNGAQSLVHKHIVPWNTCGNQLIDGQWESAQCMVSDQPDPQFVAPPQMVPYLLPTRHKTMVYTFPTVSRKSVRLPGSPISQLGKFDPLTTSQIPVVEPAKASVTEYFLGARMLKIRRHKMIKHKRMKRWARDYFKYQKYHREKKAKAEALFREQMKNLIDDYNSFNVETYIKDTIRDAKQDLMKDVAASGAHKYPHWSTLVTLEHLYGLPESDHIDKKAGIPSDEDWEQILSLKEKYNKSYRRSVAEASDKDGNKE